MPITTAGRDHLVGAITGAGTAFNNANAQLGVGNSTAVFAAAQTDLQGASKTRKAMDATYPTVATNVITSRSTFGTADGNHAWDEVGLFNAATAGTMFSRVVVALGTKTSASTFVLTHTLTITLA
ncbi:MAG: hypothetical protein M3440_07215 [Chloroflexota bacterium]|nr:hypothetical protein [Chloroflexota bacterium]